MPEVLAAEISETQRSFYAEEYLVHELQNYRRNLTAVAYARILIASALILVLVTLIPREADLAKWWLGCSLLLYSYIETLFALLAYRQMRASLSDANICRGDRL